MVNLLIEKICPKCMRLRSGMDLKCGKCGSDLKECFAKILTIDGLPVPENPESEGKMIRYRTIEEIREKIQYAIDKGIGRVRCTCGRDLKANQLMYYAHKDGIPIVAIGRQWIYLHCRHCRYDWALWKLGYGIDLEREKVPA